MNYGLTDEYELEDGTYNDESSRKKKKTAVAAWYFPSEVVVLFYDGKIGPRDLIVLGVVNSLTKTYTNGATSSCFASNKYIGERARVTPTHCSAIISKLVRLGVLKCRTKRKTNGKTKRYLTPMWRRPKAKNENL